MFVAVLIALALFFLLWWMLVAGGDEAPWLPAGLAASVVLLVAISAREVVMRRAWTRYVLEHGITRESEHRGRGHGERRNHSSSHYSAALLAIQKHSAEANYTNNSPEVHLEVFHLCQEYLNSADEALRSNLPSEKTIALRSGQEKVRSLQKHHLLTWAKDTTRQLTREAQQRARTSDKIETANRAINCLESALKAYPDEVELNESTGVLREYIASVKVAHWVELAERSAFKGHFKRAIDRYKDALFYLERETVKEDVREAGRERIKGEIEALRARIRSSNGPEEAAKKGSET
jgi:hypothetical protein